jgi:UDP-apiose/xylose synthase
VKITILGAGGFIGSHMVEHLLARGEHEIVGLDIAEEKLNGAPRSGLTFHLADIRAVPDLVDDLVRQSDLVFDLIAYANPSLYITTPVEVFDLNFMQNLRIARSCVRHGTRLVQFSSAEVYGKGVDGELYNEETSDMVFGPVNKQRWIYATAKLLLDRVLYAYGTDGKLDYTIIRPFNFIGSRIDYLVPPGSMGGPRVFCHFMSALLGGGPMYLVEGGHVHRAFLHIDDAMDAIQLILDRPEQTRNQIFNIGNPDNNVTVRQLAELMLGLYTELTGDSPQCELKEVSGETFYGVGYEDSDRLPPDISKMKALGWCPRHDLMSTLRDAMGYYLAPEYEDRRRISGAQSQAVLAASM